MRICFPVESKFVSIRVPFVGVKIEYIPGPIGRRQMGRIKDGKSSKKTFPNKTEYEASARLFGGTNGQCLSPVRTGKALPSCLR